MEYVYQKHIYIGITVVLLLIGGIKNSENMKIQELLRRSTRRSG